jgi:hypothetical protein
MYSTTGPLYHDPRYQCCCGMNVEKGAFIIGIIGTVFAILSFISAFWMSYSFGSALQLIAYICIIIAIKKRRPGFYMVFLVITGIYTVILIALCAFFLVMLIQMPDFWTGQFSDASKTTDYNTWMDAIRVLTVIFFCAFLISLAINLWAMWVVFRAYKYMLATNEMEHRHAPPQYGAAYVSAYAPPQMAAYPPPQGMAYQTPQTGPYAAYGGQPPYPVYNNAPTQPPPETKTH